MDIGTIGVEQRGGTTISVYKGRRGVWAQGDCVFIECEDATQACREYRRDMTQARIGINTAPSHVDALRAERLRAENAVLVALLKDCGAFIGPPEDHRPTSDDGLHALATRVAMALAPHWQLPDDTGGRSAMDLTWEDQ